LVGHVESAIAQHQQHMNGRDFAIRDLASHDE